MVEKESGGTVVRAPVSVVLLKKKKVNRAQGPAPKVPGPKGPVAAKALSPIPSRPDSFTLFS
jgi:hypothetical protein